MKPSTFTGKILVIIALVFLSFGCENNSTKLPVEEIPSMPISETHTIEYVRFHVYDPPLDIKYLIFESPEDSTASTPEELIMGMYSATNNQWWQACHHYDTAELPKEFFDRRSPNNFFRLLHKLSFEFYGIEYAIIKLRLYNSGKRRVGGTHRIVAQKFKYRWYRNDLEELSTLEGYLMIADTEAFKALFTGISSDDKISSAIKKTRIKDSAGLDFNLFSKLYQDIGKLSDWYLDSIIFEDLKKDEWTYID